MNYFKKVLGCDPNARELLLPSPFPPENCLTIIASHLSTIYRDRDITKRPLNALLHKVVSLHAGNYLFFFPSYEYMLKIHALFVSESPSDTLQTIIQQPNFTEEQRMNFIDHFCEHPGTNSSLIGFAVLGGIFSEGIDLVGDKLCGVAIIGVGLPGISLEQETIRKYYDTEIKEGFQFAYQFPGITKVCQAAGRLIRSERDRGIVLLIDTRFDSDTYLDLLPSYWNYARSTTDTAISNLIECFWSAGKE